MNRVINWKPISIDRNEVIRNAMSQMTTLGVQSLIVVHEDSLLGTLSDGDIRRALLSGATLDMKVQDIFNPNCRVCNSAEDRDKLSTIMNTLGLHVLPEVDELGRITAVYTRLPFNTNSVKNVSVLIMAGGKGERLRPLTENTPKPLVKIQDTSLIEILISKLAQSGLIDIFISVHYLADELISALGDGRNYGVSITYLRESVPLGTAGSISLMPSRTKGNDLLICNSDLLHDLDFATLVERHQREQSDLTIVGRKHEWIYPYGTLSTSGETLIGLIEKPRREDLISTGIYVLGQGVRNLIEGNYTYVAMSDLITRAIKVGLTCRVFEMKGYWRDVGSLESLQRAHEELWERQK